MPRSLAVVALVAAGVLTALHLPGYAILPLGAVIMVNGQNWKRKKDEG